MIRRARHDKSHMLCIALGVLVVGSTCNNVKDLFNASKAWKLEEKTFNPHGSGFLNDTFQKLHHLTLADCKSLAEFCNFAS